jgi:hypothetical protein
MKIERAGRYKDKLNPVSKRVEQVQGWLQQISAEDFLEDDKTRLASYNAFQEAVEACLETSWICTSTSIPSGVCGRIRNTGRQSAGRRCERCWEPRRLSSLQQLSLDLRSSIGSQSSSTALFSNEG